MNSKAIAIMGILAALAGGCDSSTSTDPTSDSAVDVPTGTGGSSVMGGTTGTGGATARSDGGPTVVGTGGKGVGGSLATGGTTGTGGLPVAGTGGAILASGGSIATGGRGSGGRTGTGGAISASGGRPGAGGAGSGGHPMDGGLDTGALAIDGASDAPACIDQLISAAQSGPVGYPPLSYDQCTYRGQPVYYAPPQCCDQYSKLYATDCTVICAPDGGYTGAGDGRCPDFDLDTCTLLWRDSRTR